MQCKYDKCDKPSVTLHGYCKSHKWMPTRYTPSLTGTEDFRTDADKFPNSDVGLLYVVDNLWKERDVAEQFKADEYQRWIIRHALERYPDDYADPELAGRLRWRQYVVSMGTQNGKSTLGAVFGTYGLFWHEHSPFVLSLAQSRDAAKEIYDRVGHAVNMQPVFKKKAGVTKGTGISRKGAPGKYVIRASSEKAIQGLPVSLCIYDEMHLTSKALWAQAKKRIAARKDGIIIGLTTAGDMKSELLLGIYKELEQLVAAPDETNRLGGAIWEAPEGSSLASDEAIELANPSVASGRRLVSVTRSDASGDHWVDQQRYVLNRFVEVFNPWIDMQLWHAVTGKGLLLNEGGPYFYAIDAAGDMNYATITMSAKVGDVVKTRMIVRLVKPTIEQLVKYCKYLRRANGRSAFVVHTRSLKLLGDKLKSAGMDVYILNDAEFADACKTTHRLIKWKKFDTRNEDALKMQVPQGVRKNYNQSWRIDKGHSSVELDALNATIIGAYVAETKKIGGVHVF